MEAGRADTQQSGLARVRWWYLRGLGLIFCLAFASLLPQLPELLGPQGLSPAAEWLDWGRESLDGAGRVLQLPTVLWLTGADTGALRGVAIAGFLCGLLLLGNVAPRYALVGAWGAYLSLLTVGGPFLSFQWDVLLLEAALVSLPLAPGHVWPPRVATEPRRGAVLLVRFLLFRLMVLSGLVKLASGDSTWRDFTALEYHYWTQPLPNALAYLAHQLPAWMQRASTVAMFVIELVVPFLLFGPRRVRLAGAALLALLQVGILATGSYGFFNLLTLVLCIAALDDGVPRGARVPRVDGSDAEERRVEGQGGQPVPATGPVASRLPWTRRSRWATGVFTAFALAYAVLALSQDARRLLGWRPPEPVATVLGAVGSFRSINTYGLFAVMTTTREEILIEGSGDGQTWREYLLRWRPGPVDERPRFAAPHMPRLDWQMWFAALSTCRDNPWLLRLQDALLRGEPQVREFFRDGSLPETPPRYVRTRRFDYRFTDLATLRATGAWWTREERGAYCPPLTLENGQLRRADP
ncbi:lipase maturation factor family protein [Pyxidicoccus fallax]|uniref:Lipase maturation factor 2 n=1 Tax=Pyxidicoccus fallax TaxID=394095 RepID=A0A848LXH3_9BACT|nr:lipase maturation factor family protein [Pyxidicoccus fallax]NMO22817.1 lipase maturation factor family protein [Pyxidicoccus fallax]NPC84986.1 lipase maturation factor family protein [Pyxidicoccus fallax]